MCTKGEGIGQEVKNSQPNPMYGDAVNHNGEIEFCCCKWPYGVHNMPPAALLGTLPQTAAMLEAHNWLHPVAKVS